jgi:hypothetical protein
MPKALIEKMAEERGLHKTDFVRPSWDIKENFYTINKSNFDTIRGMITYQEANSGNQKLMTTVKFEDGNYGVKVDASYNRIFENIMNERGLSYTQKEILQQSSLQKLAVSLKLKAPQYKEVTEIDKETDKDINER